MLFFVILILRSKRKIHKFYIYGLFAHNEKLWHFA